MSSFLRDFFISVFPKGMPSALVVQKMVNKTYPSSSYMQAQTYAEASADRRLMGKVVKWKWGESKSPCNIIDAIVNELNGQGGENHSQKTLKNFITRATDDFFEVG